MSWIVFWIDPNESGIQISVAITTMLTLIAYRFAVGADLPKVSYLTRLDFFILAATILVFASLLEVIVTSALAKQEKIVMARKLDNWSRWLFPAIFTTVALKTFV
jgi:cadmium resistance protein CadD (predicted permease)